MISENELESILNFELIEELESFFANKEKNEVIESLIVFSESAFDLVKEQPLLLPKNHFIWIGLSNYQGKRTVRLKVLESSDYSQFHELYRTDANILIGHSQFNPKSNSFIPAQDMNFFIESWEGSMGGSFNPFHITSNNFRYKKSA